MGVLLLVGGGTALLGWALDVPRMADWLGGGIAVQPNNAAAMAAFGASLLLWALSGGAQRPQVAGAPRAGPVQAGSRAISLALAATVACLGAATLWQHVFKMDLGIDRALLFGRSWGSLNVNSPGRMGPPASICWMLLGASMCGTALRLSWVRWLWPLLTLIAMGTAWIGLLGVVYSVDTLYTLPRLTAIAPMTTVFLLAAGVGMLAAMPRNEPARTILRDGGAAGRLARGAILPLLVIAPAIGYLRLRGEQAGLYDSVMGAAITVVAISIVSTVLLWRAGRDLTRHEAAIQASDGLAKRIAGIAPVILYVYDLAERRNVWANKGMTDVLGYTRAQVEAMGGRLLSTLMHPEDLERYDKYYARLLALRDDESVELEYRLRHADGTWRWLHSRDTIFSRDRSGRVQQILGAASDVTRRRDAEDALRQSQAIFAIARDAAALGIYEYEPETGQVTWDARLRELWGLGLEDQVTYQTFADGLHPDDLAATQAAVDRAFNPLGLGVYFAEFRVVVPERPLRWVAATGRVMRSAGQAVRLVGTVQDVTERRESEEQARESASRLRLALEAAEQGAWSQEGPGGVLRWDERMRQIWGLPGGDPVRYAAWLASVYPDDRERIQAAVDAASAGSGEGRYRQEYRILRASDGAERWVEVVAQVRGGEPGGEPSRWFGTARDVTERRTAQDELRAHRERLEQLVKQRTDELDASHQRLRLAERMAALGTLSAGLGHDMGNILMPLRVRLETLEHVAGSKEALAEIEAIRSLIAYLQRLAGGLRMLAVDPSRAASGSETTELLSWWPEAETVMRSALPRTLSLSCTGVPATVDVPVSRAALTQAVFNLVQNAGDAMREMGGGTVTIGFQTLDDQVLVGVSDTGPGMTEEVRRRCMEPFFTTKTRGLSTGLGLALVYGLVREAGGTVELESTPGKGTTFTLRLPRASRSVSEASTPRHALVLVADERMRAFIAAELKHMGRTVHTRRPADGVPIDLLVVDGDGETGQSKNVIRIAAGMKMSDIRAAIRVGGMHPSVPAVSAS